MSYNDTRYSIQLTRSSAVAEIQHSSTKKTYFTPYIVIIVDVLCRINTTFYLAVLSIDHMKTDRESWFFHTPLHSTSPLGGFPSEYCHPIWHGKTRMVWLPDGEKISKMCLFVLTWSTNVTDGRTDTAWRLQPRLCIASRRKNWSYSGCSGVVVEYQTCNQEVAGSTHTQSTACNLANPLCAQANSNSYLLWDGKWVVATATGWRPSVADWGDGVSASCTVNPTVH